MPDLGTLGKYTLSELPHEHGCKVILTGEGSDEHFAGYSPLLTDFLREKDYSGVTNGDLSEEDRLAQLNARQQRSGINPANPGKPNLADLRLIDPSMISLARKQVNNVSMIEFADFFSSLSSFAPWTESEFGKAERPTTVVHNAIDGVARAHAADKWHPLHSALYLWTKSGLPNILLVVLGDRVEMAHSIECRQPFLDHHLTEYVMSLPPDVKIRYIPETKSFSEKWILKEAMKPFVTKEIYERHKHPFTAPVKYQVGGPVHQALARLVTKGSIDALGFLDWEKCEHLVDDAIIQADPTRMRELIVIAQLIAIGKRFGVKEARPEFPGSG